jgi:serine/threonine protein kinase
MPALSEDPELEARVRARVGSTLRGKYRLDDVLGIGGMAAVYSATHRNGRRVAVKLLHPELSLSSEARGRFLREGLVANTVRHPGVVTILDDDTHDDGAAFLVMELLEGATLDELWERYGRRLPLPAVVAAGILLLDILSAAHAAGVVHRDIKPANLFLTQSRELKILDFGISRLRDAKAATSTQTGMMMGSPAFMAPEQALGRTDDVDGRTDLWSAAASLFALASGEFVHEGQTAQEMLIRAATVPVRSLAVALPDAPALVVAVLDRALAFAKTERWATAGEMSVALSEAARACFGEEPSIDAFAPLMSFTGSANPRASGASGGSGVPTRISGTPAPLFQPAAGGPGWGPGVGSGVTHLTSSITGAMGAPESRRRKRAAIVGGAALVGVLVGTAVLLGRASRGPETRAAETATNTGAAGERAERAADIAKPVPAPPAAVDVSALPEAESAPSDSPATAPGAPSRSGVLPRATAQPRSAPARSAGKPGTFIPPARSAAPAAPADPCNPPYRFDFFGNKVAKPGCSF